MFPKDAHPKEIWREAGSAIPSSLSSYRAEFRNSPQLSSLISTSHKLCAPFDFRQPSSSLSMERKLPTTLHLNTDFILVSHLSSVSLSVSPSLTSPETTNSSLFAHRTSFDYGFGTNLVSTNTCVSSNLVNNHVQFKIDGVKQIWGRFYYNDYNSIFCVMGYSGAECSNQYLQVMDNWTSSSTCTLCQT
jgi:hypothetical protein